MWRCPTTCISWNYRALTTWFGSGWRLRVSAPPAGHECERTASILSNTAPWLSLSLPLQGARSSRGSPNTHLTPSPGTVAVKALQCSQSSGTPPAQKQAWDPAPLEQKPPAGSHPPGQGLPTRCSQTAPCETSRTNSWKVSQLHTSRSLIFLQLFLVFTYSVGYCCQVDLGCF